MSVQPAGDGWRVLADCADGCGASVVCLPEYAGRARCGACGRAATGAVADGTRIPPDRPPVSMPARLDPDRLTRLTEVKSAAAILPTRGLVEEWPIDDPRLPARVVKFIAECAGARVCHTVSSAGETIGVHLPQQLAAMFERREVAASVRHRKVDLKRTKTGRRKVQRFDPIVTPAHTDWPSYVLVRAGRGLVKVTVTAAIQILRQRAET